MKKILTSVGIVVFAVAIVVGGTGAFFSDSEISTGNVFTAGALDLTVDSEAHYNGSICLPDLDTPDLNDYTWQNGTEYPVGLPCTGTWEATDLGAKTFFNYADIKPGDYGENTISLHINNNPAWACVDVNITQNDDMSSTEPELAVVGEVQDVEGDLFDGELAENMKFAAWLDQGATPGWQGKDGTDGGDEGEGDNIWQGEEDEPLLFANDSGPASDVLGGKSYPLADMTTLGGPMQPMVTNYIGLAWCAGTQTIVGDSITCDGSTLGNIVQTDSMEATIAFRVEQHRNNPNFRCTPTTTPPVASSTVTVDKIVSFTNAAIQGVAVTDFELHLVGPNGDQIVIDEVPTVGLPAGMYTISEIYSNDPADIAYDAIFSGACTEIGDTNTATMTVAAGANVTCTIMNMVVSEPEPSA